jgi:radical SAM protein with 4Fe4S-binding SPASM domain
MRLETLGRPFSASFEVTSQCGLHCHFCSARLLEYGRVDMSTEDVVDVIRRISSAGVLSVFLTGGEPLTRRDLPEIIRACVECGMNLTLSTNGTLATPSLARNIASAGLDEIQISIHGLGPVHDRIVGVEGAYTAAVFGLECFVGAGVRVSVASVGIRANVRSLPDLAREVASRGAKYFRLLRLMPHSVSMLSERLSCEDSIRLARGLKAVELDTPGFVVCFHASPGLPDERYWSDREYHLVHPLCHTCSAGKLSMAVLSDGDCVPCLELKSPQFVCGNVLRDSLEAIWASEPMLRCRMVSPEAYAGACGGCEAKWTCYSARCTAFHLGGNILGDDATCYRLGTTEDDSGRRLEN